MKVLTAQFYFALPDDFAGDPAAALRQLADYFAERRSLGEIEFSRESRTLPPEVWQGFLDALPRGKRMHGVLAVNVLPGPLPQVAPPLTVTWKGP
jgi:hypothetical protein